jgi:hypothetical protein
VGDFPRSVTQRSQHTYGKEGLELWSSHATRKSLTQQDALSSRCGCWEQLRGGLWCELQTLGKCRPYVYMPVRVFLRTNFNATVVQSAWNRPIQLSSWSRVLEKPTAFRTLSTILCSWKLWHSVHNSRCWCQSWVRWIYSALSDTAFFLILPSRILLRLSSGLFLSDQNPACIYRSPCVPHGLPI